MNPSHAPAVIGDLLARGAISPSVTAPGKRQALCVVAEISARVYGLKASRVLDALLEREAVSATGVGHGVAIPHAEIDGLDRMRGVFVRLRPPIDFGSVDDGPVDLIFAILAPPNSATEHLRTLARVARSLRAPDIRQQLRQAAGADAIAAVLTRDARPTAA